MKTLICLSGQVRCFEPFFESFRHRIVAQLPQKPDLVAHFAAPEVAEAERLRELAGAAVIRFEEDPELEDEEVDALSAGMMEQRHGVRGNLLQWHNLERCADLKRELEADRGPYDLVIWSRPDLYYVTPIEELRSGPDRLHVPAHDSYGGVMDRMCFGPSREMDTRMRIREYFVTHFHPHRVVGSDPPPRWNPERVLAAMVEDEFDGRVARTRVITLRLRQVETEGEYEVCRPVCRLGKYPHDGLVEPVFEQVFRRSRKLRWPPRGEKVTERRLPLSLVARRLAPERSSWAEAAARLADTFQAPYPRAR